MNGDKSSGFRFRIDEESPDSILREDTDIRKLKKLSSRVTWLTIIIPLILGIAIAAGYYDLKKSASKLRGLDVTQVESLSKDLNSKFSSLSLQTAKMEESIQKIQESFKLLQASFDKKVLPLDEIFLVFEKTTSALKKDLQESQKAIGLLKSVKIDKTEVLNRLEKIENKISPFNRHLKNMESEIKALDENLTQELAELSGNFYKLQSEMNQFEKIQKDISALSSAKLDTKGLQTELKDQEKRLQQELKKLNQDLRKKEDTLKSMEGQIEELMKFKALSEIKKRLQPAASPSPQQPAAEKQPPKTPKPKAKAAPDQSGATLLPPPEPGKIIEENLKP